ncbi:hypothetical protein [Chryseobacterium sp. CT-SW4]|uniref:hypothetical protein n=1 Tax=Chryseobacterium sp. SW-1 TaxID=3157343 RepID=UPI003B014D32
MINKYKLICIFTTFICVLIVLFSSRRFLDSSLSFIYLIQLGAFVTTTLKQTNNRFFIFSPSFITLLYLNLNFILGHYTVSSGFGMSSRYFDAYIKYTNLNFISAFILICNLLVYLSLNFKKLRRAANVSTNKAINVKNNFIYTLLAIIFALNFITIDLSFLGGNGDFTYIFKLTTAALVVYLSSFKKGKLKYLLYLVLLLLFLIGNYDSKREIMYVLILIIFVEVIQNKINIHIKIKHLLLGSLIFIGFIYIVLVSSILRGYGNFNVKSPIDAFGYVSEYIKADYISDALTENFELNTVYGNGTNAINYVYNDEVPLLYGTTFIKFLFIPIPRSIYPDKPESMINVYTSKFAPEFRSIGGSYPVIVYSEAMWNFHIFGWIIIYFLFYIINMMYVKLIKLLQSHKLNMTLMYLLFMYITLIQFVRGSGFEMWFLYGLLSLPLSVIYVVIYKTKKLKK